MVKVTGEAAKGFLHGLVTADIQKLGEGEARFCALLTPQGKIIADFIAVAAPAKDGGGYLSRYPEALGTEIVDRLNRYKLRAKVLVEDLSETLGVLAVWDGSGATRTACATPTRACPRSAARIMLPPHHAAAAAADLGATFSMPRHMRPIASRSACPAAALDFSYGDAFPHETDMDQFSGVDFTKGCYVGQEVVSRMEHRSIARTRAVPVRYDGTAPAAGAAVMAGERKSASWARPPPVVASRCCGSTGSPEAIAAARRCAPARWTCSSPSRTGRALPFRAKSKAAE